MKKSALLASLGFGVVGLGGGLFLHHAVPMAQAQSPAPTNVTPKTQVPQEAKSLSQGFASTAKALRPSVVRLDIEQENPSAGNRRFRRDDVPPEMERFFEHFFGQGGDGFPQPQPGPGRGTGSGVVIDNQGNIITNSHVAEKASKVTVIFADGREFPAKVVGADPKTDVAVVRIQNPPSNLISARLGDSTNLEVGEWVLAIGSPLGLDQSVTAGIISSRGKVTRNVHMSGERMREYIQTDAKINPGNSGGPLVNLQGEVIGINTLINVGPGGAYGFAIPINKAKQVARAIISDGRYRHAWLGIGIGDIRDGEKLGNEGEGVPGKNEKAPKGAPPKAAWVNRVMPGSPAAQAGIQVNDLITRIDGQAIEGANDVVDYVSGQRVGGKVNVQLLRDGKSTQVQVTLAELPENPMAMNDGRVEKDRIGVQLQSLSPEMAGMLGLPADAKGVVVTEVERNSRAAKAGLVPEDVIVEINRKPVADTEGAVAALKAGAKGSLLLKIRRGQTSRFVTIPAP